MYRRAYTYDANSRLDSANYPGHPLADYAYDWVGNRTDLSGAVYNAADQLASRTGHTYSYNGAGSMTADNSTVYAYTPANLLQSVTNGALTSSMTWDAGGNRVSFTTSGSNTYTYVYDPTAGIPAVIEEVTPSGSVYYVREPNGALIARISGTGENQTTHYYHFDDLGSTLFLTGSAGTITDEYTYDPWGNVTSHTGTTSQPYQYVGELGYYTHWQDTNMGGLLQLGVRLYDPTVGRFTQRDPDKEGLNWYVYGDSNPVLNVDPSGYKKKDDDAKKKTDAYIKSVITKLINKIIDAARGKGSFPIGQLLDQIAKLKNMSPEERKELIAACEPFVDEAQEEDNGCRILYAACRHCCIKLFSYLGYSHLSPICESEPVCGQLIK